MTDIDIQKFFDSTLRKANIVYNCGWNLSKLYFEFSRLDTSNE